MTILFVHAHGRGKPVVDAKFDGAFLEDKALTWREKGILTYLVTRETGTKLRIKELQKWSLDGRDAIYKAIKALSQKGYIVRLPIRKEGVISEWALVVYARKKKYPRKHAKRSTSGFSGSRGSTSGFSGSRSSLLYLSLRERNISVEGCKQPRQIENTKPPSSQQRNKHFAKYATLLSKTITSAKNIKVTTQKLKQWSEEIRKLKEIDGVSEPRIEAALEWYHQNIGGQYIPVIESGRSLRQKFLRLESAMERAGDLVQERANDERRLKIKVGRR